MQSRVGVHEKSVEIMKPYIGSIQNGLQLHIRISEIVQESETNPLTKLIITILCCTAKENGTLQEVIYNEWKLSELPQIGNISCVCSISTETENLKAMNIEESEHQQQMVSFIFKNCQ